MTAEVTTPSADIAREGNRMLLLAAVARQIVCPFTDTVLDVRRAVLIVIDGGPAVVMAAAHWDECGPGFLASRPGTEVIDGRTL